MIFNMECRRVATTMSMPKSLGWRTAGSSALILLALALLWGQGSGGSLASLARKKSTTSSTSRARVVITNDHLSRTGASSRRPPATARSSRYYPPPARRSYDRPVRSGAASFPRPESGPAKKPPQKTAKKPVEGSPFITDYEFGKYSSPNQVRADHWGQELDSYHTTNPRGIESKESAAKGLPGRSPVSR